MFYFREEWENLMANFRKDTLFKAKNILSTEVRSSGDVWKVFKLSYLKAGRDLLFRSPLPQLYILRHTMKIRGNNVFELPGLTERHRVNSVHLITELYVMCCTLTTP